jgi:hypothetical protein
MRIVLAGILLSTALAIPRPVQAWNHKGHMVVAYIAYDQLTPAERARVFAVLKMHPDFARLSKLAGSPKSGNYQRAVFVQAARWPDLIRDDKRFYDENDPDEEPTPKLAGFPDMKKHKGWHFMDRGFTDDGTPVSEPEHINAQTSIHAFRVSVGKADSPAKAYFLAWVEHMIGDVHQPLHCVARFSAEDPRGDRGGNFFELVPFKIPGVKYPPDNLHSLWDDLFGAETTITAVGTVANEAEASTPTEGLDVVDEAVWTNESFEYAKSAAYGPLSGLGKKPQITQEYFAGARALALKRAKLAGHRLAAFIKANLK